MKKKKKKYNRETLANEYGRYLQCDTYFINNNFATEIEC